MREATRAEQERIWELIDEGWTPPQIVLKMVQAGFERKWSTAAVDHVLEEAMCKVYGRGQ